MDTNVQTVDENALIDLFPSMAPIVAGGGTTPKFGQEESNIDILGGKTSSSATEETTVEVKSSTTTEETTLEPTKKEGEDVDILGETREKTVTPITDLSNYYQERIKNGTFIAVDEVDEKGNKIPFIPKTAEEYDEVLQLQIDYRLNEAKKDLEKNWYESKSPAWKAVSQYAEMVDDPTQLIPFLQGVKVLTSVANLDENEIDGAEQIVRTRMLQNGEPEEIINQQIDVLKTADKLIATAKQYKPIIIKHEQQLLAADAKEKEQQQLQWQHLVADIRDNALKAIEQPIFGKTKLKTEEKAAIYDLIGEPSDTTQGYGIYNVIDNLFEKRDFETLKLVSLLLSKKEAFFQYLGTNVANQTAASLEKKLRLAGDAHKASGNDYDEENRVAVTRNQFKTKPTFGR